GFFTPARAVPSAVRPRAAPAPSRIRRPARSFGFLARKLRLPAVRHHPVANRDLMEGMAKRTFAWWPVVMLLMACGSVTPAPSDGAAGTSGAAGTTGA